MTSHSAPLAAAEWSSTTAAIDSSTRPVTGTARSPDGRVFSWTIRAVSSAIQIRLATPAANMTSISAQQQPRQKRPWPAPSRKPAAAPRR